LTAKIALLPAARQEQRQRQQGIIGNLALSRSGFEVFAALIAELGNGAAPEWLDRFAEEEFGGTWDEVSEAFLTYVREMEGQE
jgi:hypothetical protein